MVKPGATVIDVGITKITCPNTGKPKLVGDVDFEGKFISFGFFCYYFFTIFFVCICSCFENSWFYNTSAWRSRTYDSGYVDEKHF